MKYLVKITENTSTLTSNECTLLYEDLFCGMNFIHSIDDCHAKIYFCPEGWRKYNSGIKPSGKVYTIYEYDGED